MEVWHLGLNRNPWVSVLAVGLCAAIAGLILYFALLSPFPLPDHWWLRGHNDTVLHALAFGAFTVPLALLFRPWSSLILASVAAALVELMQVPLPRRSATFGDFLAGVAGAVVVAALALLIRRMRQ